MFKIEMDQVMNCHCATLEPFFSAGWTVNNNNLPPQSPAQAQFILNIAAAVYHLGWTR